MQVERNTVARSSNVYTSSAFLLWRFNVAGNDQTCLDLQVNFLIFSPDFNQICTSSTDFRESLQYQISRKIRPLGAGLIHADGRTRRGHDEGSCRFSQLRERAQKQYKSIMISRES